MTRKVTSPLRINPKKIGAFSKPCVQETVKFLSCLAINNNNDEKCAKPIELLQACMSAQAAQKRKPWGSINFQLQKFDKKRR